MPTAADRLPRPLAALGRHPSGVLLGAQLLVVLAYPALQGSDLGLAFAGVFQLLVLLAAVAAVRRTPALTWVALLLGVPAVVLTVAEAFQPDSDGIVLASAVFHAPFYFFVSYALIRYLFHDDKVTRDELFATGAAFTVVAWGFAYLYAAAQVLWPGAFISYTSPTGAVPLDWFELLFLSFTAMTSVGLSDVYPVLAHARSLVMVEQVAGVFYVALVVARLVGLSARRRD
ncbi:ion channel [Nocardioides sp. WV_118_6]|uniref:ion channel n=1 Tax=Pimelobacter TaxID=2044 RepID=UPI00214FB5C6|nr:MULTISPECIES: ion channel [Pimelobacter]MBU2696427.1 Ion channel [Pimelobacter sp. 30-1]UUW87846.1 ion channel [Pimelobacter simplex]UUW97351.1 ion channel [Pimelobacter simplex]